MRILVILASISLAGGLPAQQANLPGASMLINGRSGPPFPIANVPAPRGSTQALRIGGLPGSPFVTFGGAALLPSGIPALGAGLLDVDLGSGFFLLLDGLQNPAYLIDASGIFTAEVPMPATAALGPGPALQTLVADPTTAAHARLTAATGLTVVPAVTVLNLSVPHNGGVIFTLVPYGMTFPFYANVYSHLYVNENGNLTFGSPHSDFTPTPFEFRIQPPRIAPMWSDHEIVYGGRVRATVDPGGYTNPYSGNAQVRVDWIDMAERANIGPLHTYHVLLDIGLGDITIVHDPLNRGSPSYSQFMGISPGNNLLPPPPNNVWSAQKDLSRLSAYPTIGFPDEAFWEWFGLTTMVDYVAPTNNRWDMAGRTTRFFAVGAGSAGAHYVGL